MKRICLFLIITVLFAGTVTAQSRFDRQDESAQSAKPAQPTEQGRANRQRDPNSARNRENRQREPNSARNRNRQNAPETVTIEGTLQLENGTIALASGDNVYFVPMLMRYAGFIEGIKEGGKVTVEGYQFRNMLHPKKVTVNGKDYDFPAMGFGNNFQGGGNMQGGMGFGFMQNRRNFGQGFGNPRMQNRPNRSGRR